MKKHREIVLQNRRTLTLQEIEMFYGIPGETVRKWIKRDLNVDKVPRLDSFRPGKDILVFKDVLEEYIKRFPVSA